MSENYWVTVNDDLSILLARCPAGNCCQNPKGCLFMDNNNTALNSDICAENRDPEIPLCGRCKLGYSEVVGTNACR